MVAERTGSIVLDLGGSGDDVAGNLSASVRMGATLFLAADEGLCIERTGFSNGRWARVGGHSLCDFVTLLDPEAEADIEGLAVSDDWLWVVGSHARTRPKTGSDGVIDLAEFADLKDTRGRCVLARLPLVPDPDLPGGYIAVQVDGDRRAGIVKQTAQGSGLMQSLAAMPLLAPFAAIPAKEGGIDVEGVAVCGDRVALGLRGPVLCGKAAILECRWRAGKKGGLKIVGEPVVRLLELDGLGVRDLKLHGGDLLILAGPTVALAGPCAVYRWAGWGTDPPQDPKLVRLHAPERLLDLPTGDGKPEGLALWDDGRLLVVCDSPRGARVHGDGCISADLYALP
jgi:hypothetical protein